MLRSCLHDVSIFIMIKIYKLWTIVVYLPWIIVHGPSFESLEFSRIDFIIIKNVQLLEFIIISQQSNMLYILREADHANSKSTGENGFFQYLVKQQQFKTRCLPNIPISVIIKAFKVRIIFLFQPWIKC
jgi:hypothetical protein